MPARRLAPLLAVAALCLASASAHAAQLVVTLPHGGGEQTLELASLVGQEDVHDQRYALRDADGHRSTTTVADGWSLALLLRSAGVELDDVGYVRLARADGSELDLLRDEALATGQDGEPAPPVVWLDAQGLHLLRPSSGAGDANALDLVTAPDGSLALGVERGDPFAVRIEASALHARPQRPLRFHALLTAGAAGPAVTFSWYFGDGPAAGDDARVTHRFAQPGRYRVQVNVVVGGRQLDANDIVDVRIGSPPTSRPQQHEQPVTPPVTPPAATPPAASGGQPAVTTAAAATTTPAAAPRRVAPARAPAPRGDLVSGTLLASAEAAPLPASTAGAGAPSAGAPATDRPLDIPVGAWIALGLLVLVALGFSLESRHIPPFLQP